MTRGEATLNKVHYQGNEDDFLVFVDDLEDFKKWQGDRSVPLANFVGNFKVYITHKQGAQGQYDGASKTVMSNEFGTDNEDEVIKIILEKGNLESVTVSQLTWQIHDSDCAILTYHFADIRTSRRHKRYQGSTTGSLEVEMGKESPTSYPKD